MLLTSNQIHGIVWYMAVDVWVEYIRSAFVFKNDNVKANQKSLHRPGQELKATRFQGNRDMKVVRLSALSTGCLYPQETFLVLIPVRRKGNSMFLRNVNTYYQTVRCQHTR